MAGLIANGAIERMVDEEKLEVVLLRPMNNRTRSVRSNHHPVSNIDRAARLKLREILDYRSSVVVQLDLTCLPVFYRRTNFDQALATIRGYGEGRMIAEMRQFQAPVETKLK